MTIQLEGEWRRVVPKTLVYSNGSMSVECTGGILFNTKIVKLAHDPASTEKVDPVVALRDPRVRRFELIRDSALGDVIVATACLRAIKKVFPHLMVSLYTRDAWAPLLQLQSDVNISSGRPRIKGEYSDHLILNFDSFYEIDHLPEGVKVSRVDRTMGTFDLEGTPVDFSLPIPEKELAEARKLLPEEEGPWVAVSVRRTNIGACRSPAESLVFQICRKLRDAGLGVYVVEGHDQIDWADAIGVKWRRRSTILQTAAAMKLCSVVATPDSGSMWLAHVTETPMVLWMGPTPGAIKGKHHKLWPHGVRVIQTNEWINCPSCFEYEEACEWTSRCIARPDPVRFVEESVKAMKELVELHV